MTELSDYIRCVSDPHAAALEARISALSDALTLSDEARVRAEEKRDEFAEAITYIATEHLLDSACAPSCRTSSAIRARDPQLVKAQALILRAGNLGSSGANECGAGSQANLADPGGGSFDGCEPTAVTEAIELATAGLKRGDPPAVVIRDLLKALGRPAPSRPDCSAAQSLDGKGAA